MPTITKRETRAERERRLRQTERQSMERRAEEENYARQMQQMLAQQEAAYSLPTAEGVGQIPTGLQQAGYEPGKYVSTAADPYRGVRERWFGGRRGRAQELLAAWAGGGQPLRVARQEQQMLGMSDAMMSLMGYGREPLGSWRAKPYQAPGAAGDGGGDGGVGGGGYGYPRYRGGGYGGGYPSGGYYQPPGVGVGRISTRGTSRAVGYGTGLINWRI